MKLKDINWNQVYYFYEVARGLSMKEAAQATGVSLPTVSEQIKRLESSLKLILFRRFPRRLELTSEGESLFELTREMFDSGERILAALLPEALPGKARIGLQDSLGESLALDFLLRYRRAEAAFPALGLEVSSLRESSVELEHGLNKGSFDWVLTYTPAQAHRHPCALIEQDEVVFVVSRSQAERQSSGGEILRQLPLALSSWDRQFNELVTNHLSSEGLNPAKIWPIEPARLRFQLAASSQCANACLRRDVPPDLALSEICLAKPLLYSCYAVWRRANERLACVQHLLRTLPSLAHEAQRSSPSCSGAYRDSVADSPQSIDRNEINCAFRINTDGPFRSA